MLLRKDLYWLKKRVNVLNLLHQDPCYNTVNCTPSRLYYVTKITKSKISRQRQFNFMPGQSSPKSSCWFACVWHWKLIFSFSLSMVLPFTLTMMPLHLSSTQRLQNWWRGTAAYTLSVNSTKQLAVICNISSLFANNQDFHFFNIHPQLFSI